MNRLLVAAAVAVAPACPLFAQTAADAIVAAPEVLVAESRLRAAAEGQSTSRLRPETTAAITLWDQASRLTPNFHVAESGAGGYGSLFALRGLANTPYFSEPAVTLYFDDLPLPGSFTYPTELFGFGSFMLARGPQGTLVGRATDGGVVTVRSRLVVDPSAGSLLVLSAGDYDDRSAAAASQTTAGPVAAEIAGAYHARKGYIENRQLGRRVDDQENAAGFARLDWHATPSATFSLEALATRGRDGAQPLVPLGGPHFTVRRSAEGVTDLDSTVVALKGSFVLPIGSLSTVTSFTAWRMNPYQNFLVLPPPLASVVHQQQQSWNEEMRWMAATTGHVRGSAGLWLSSRSTRNTILRSIPGLFPIEGSDFLAGDHTAAVFGSLDVLLAPGWTLTAGARLQRNDRTFARHEQVPRPGLGYARRDREGALLPRLALQWTPARQTHLEAAVAAGARAGGYSSFTDDPALIPFAAERVTTVSIGAAEGFADNAASLAVRLFHTAIRNYQIERSYTQTDYFVATAPRAHADGAEVEAAWRPSAPWIITATAGFTQTRLDEFRAPVTGTDETGHRAPYIPRYDGTLDVAYAPTAGWFAAAQLHHVGETAFDELGTPLHIAKAYVLLGGRIGYTARRYTVTFYGENLADAEYAALIVAGIGHANPGSPRTFGAKVALRW